VSAAPSVEQAPGERVLRIKPTQRFVVFNLGEVWEYRELLFFLTWRDIKVRYKQTALGAAWAVIQPFTSMIIFSVIFGRLAGVPSEYGVPYPIFVYSGLLPWTYFAACLSQSSLSVTGGGALVTKVYFPRLILPLASVAVPLIDFVIAFTVLIGMFLYYGIVPDWHAVFIPIFLLMALVTAFGVGLWLSALNVRYRDIPYVIPFLTQLWLYASPVIYPVTLIPDRWRWLLALNPMSGVIDGFRWAVLGQGSPRYLVLAVSAVMGVLIMSSGLVYFKHVERRFADVM
jgi:lipopolysaccharide transport system permease protein